MRDARFGGRRSLTRSIGLTHESVDAAKSSDTSSAREGDGDDGYFGIVAPGLGRRVLDRNQHSAAVWVQPTAERRGDPEAACGNLAHGSGALQDRPEQARRQLYPPTRQGRLEHRCKGELAREVRVRHRHDDKCAILVRPSRPGGTFKRGEQQGGEH